MKKVYFILLLSIFGIAQIMAVSCGDVDSSGTVDIVDALLIAKHYVGSDTIKFDSKVADVSGDNLIDIVDALLVAQFYVGQISSLSGCSVATNDPPKPIASKRLRVMATSDFPPFPVTNSDPDDVQSMVRFLLYANEFDIEGLIAAAGTFGMVAEKKNIHRVLDKYDQVVANLKKHDPKYPSTDYLRSVTYEGKGNNHGVKIRWGCNKQNANQIIGAGKDSEASDAIIAAAMKNDPRPIYIGVWGGPREIAQAIWNVQNKGSKAELNKIISKLRVYLILCQDSTDGWLVKNFPKLHIIQSRYTYQGMFKVGSRQWAEQNIIKNHGPLCAIYPPKAMGGAGVIEGDSPTFMYLISAAKGINDPEDPTQPSWGGQYKRVGNGTNHYIDGPGRGTIKKWAKDFQADFAKRADWCVR